MREITVPPDVTLKSQRPRSKPGDPPAPAPSWTFAHYVLHVLSEDMRWTTKGDYRKAFRELVAKLDTETTKAGDKITFTTKTWEALDEVAREFPLAGNLKPYVLPFIDAICDAGDAPDEKPPAPAAPAA